MSVTVNVTDPYLEQFDAFAKATGETEPAWLRTLRATAIERFRTIGFPTLKDEDWKHTDLRTVVRAPFRFDPSPVAPRVPGDLIEAYTFGVLKCSQLVFLNGRFAPKLSYLRWLPEGVRIGSLHEILHFDPKALQHELGKSLSTERQPFAALNTALLQDGALVHVPR